MGSQHHRSGFTLTELLVSLMILGLISMAATSALSVGKQIWQKVQVVPDLTLSEAEKNHLRQVVERRISALGNEGGGVSGTRNALHFSGLTQTSAGYDVIGVISIQRGASGITIRTVQSSAAQAKQLRHLIGADFSYFGRKNGWKADDWSDTWDASDPPPKLVKFSFPTREKYGPDELIVKIP